MLTDLAGTVTSQDNATPFIATINYKLQNEHKIESTPLIVLMLCPYRQTFARPPAITFTSSECWPINLGAKGPHKINTSLKGQNPLGCQQSLPHTDKSIDPEFNHCMFLCLMTTACPSNAQLFFTVYIFMFFNFMY